jgi:hypothetical protein
MEQVIDKLRAELTTFSETLAEDGGCADILNIQAVYFGDPGLIPSILYPCFTVEPTRDDPESETTGYDVRSLQASITVLIDARDYFDATVDEADGDRRLVQTMQRLQRWLRTVANRHLDDQEGVREVRITRVEYTGQVRGEVISKTAQVFVEVDKQYPKVRS